MGLIVNKQNPKNVNYNIKGSGLLYVPEPFCMAESCKPKPNPTPKGPTPKPKKKYDLVPLTATKQGPDTNKWELKGAIYPTFNSLWVNIPRQQYTLLKRRNGQISR